MQRVSLLASLLTLAASPVIAQEDEPRASMGDPAVRERLSIDARAIYDAVTDWRFAMTGENLLHVEDAHGTEVRGGLIDGVPLRLVANDGMDSPSGVAALCHVS
jgi:hypothetical protein